MLKQRTVLKSMALGVVLPWMLLGCGGGGSADPSPRSVGKQYGLTSEWQENVFPSSDSFAEQCATPNVGDLQGSAHDEKMWLRSWTNEDYLWYDEVADVDPAGFTVVDYFYSLRTEELTASGNYKDRFHYYYEETDWESLLTGIVSGYGLHWIFSPGLIRIAYVEPGSPGDLAGFERGDAIIGVDGIDITKPGLSQDSIDLVDMALYPALPFEHRFVVESLAGESRIVLMKGSDSIATSAVFHSSVIDTDTGAVGYMVFNSHNNVAQDELIIAVERFIEAGVSDLVLDLRYNGGGSLYVASQLAYMVAGDTVTGGKAFNMLKFNDKYPSVDSETSDSGEVLPFISDVYAYTSEGLVLTGEVLPALNLNRVFVLTAEETCSASEAIINGLRGVGVDVIQIGGTTCGKPYGFIPKKNCGNIYFSINFKNVNDKGFGDYPDGFSPLNTPGNAGYRIEGCYGKDDFEYALGDENEGLLAQALQYRESGSCRSVLSSASKVEEFSVKKPGLSSDVLPFKKKGSLVPGMYILR